MDVRLVRNATIKVDYAGKRFLVDPVLAAKGSFRAFGTNIRPELKNPIVDLTMPIDEIIDVDAVVITHMHLDHFDPDAKELLPKTMKIFVQNDEDASELIGEGFQDVEILNDKTLLGDIELVKTPGQHGSGEVLDMIGHACGVVFKNPNEKTLYIVGDTIWYDEVKVAIETYKPDIIVVNAGDNKLMDTSLVMGKNDIYEVHKAKPDSIIVAVHMEAMNHWTLSRKELKDFIEEKGILGRVLVPDDGEAFTF